MKMHVFHWSHSNPLPFIPSNVIDQQLKHTFMLLWDDGSWTWGHCVFIQDGKVIQAQDTNERIWDVESYCSYDGDDWDTPSYDDVLRANGVDPHDKQSFI